MKKAFEIQTEFFKDKPDSICYLDAIMRGKLHVLKYYPLMRKMKEKYVALFSWRLTNMCTLVFFKASNKFN